MTYKPKVVLCGSLRRDPVGMKVARDALVEACQVMSPQDIVVEGEREGFVFLAGQSGQDPVAIERRHVMAMEEAAFVWLHCPGGYVGLSGALEIGWARAKGIPVFAAEPPSDVTLSGFVEVTDMASKVQEALGKYYWRKLMLEERTSKR